MRILHRDRPRGGNAVCSAAHVSTGFTLVELLVVIGIIAVLISILMPALDAANKQARRISCLSNLRQLAQLCVMYSGENKGYFPPSNWKDTTGTLIWSYAFDCKNSLNPSAGAMGLGLLISTGIISPEVAPSLFHDKSLDDSNAPFPGHCMNVVNPWGKGVSWFDITTADRIIDGFDYRSASWYRTTNEQLKLGSFPQTFVLISDMLDPRFGRIYTHRDGYNFVRADASGQWYEDKNGQIDGMITEADGQANPFSDETVYTLLQNAP